MSPKKKSSSAPEGDEKRPQTAPRTRRPNASLLSLESRLMFDAAAAATAAEVKTEQVAQEQAEIAVSGEGAVDGQVSESSDSQDLLQALSTFMPAESRTEVVFVDPTVPNYRDLLSGMDPNIEVIMLDGGSDGIEQVASALSGRTGIDAIHLISHGDAGTLQLGTGSLSSESMTGRYADELSTIQQALSEQADILVYGCDFAEGETGQTAVDLLAELTGADVQASSDLTGNETLGGDWDLEVQTGSIETQVAIADETQMNWIGVLAETWMNASTGTVIGGPAGNDWYVGDSADNAPTAAGGGADIMYGAGGNDTLQGGSGNDILVGGAGNDTISGNSDDDVILGGTGSDYLDGGSAVTKNTIIGGGGSDTMVGGSGGDIFRFTGAQSGDAYTVDGGGSTDIIDLSEFSTATITNSGGVITVDRGGGNVFTITHSNVESIVTAATVGNHGPLADAGSDQTVATSATVTLTAAGSSDQDGNTLTYQWTQIEGPKVTLSSSTAASPTFTAPGSATTLEFIVVVSDGTTSHADTVTISVGVVNSAPTVSNLSGDTLNYTEDSGAVVIDQGANALVTDSDSANFDTGTLTISISVGGEPTEDVLGIRNQGSGAGQIGVSGSNVTYGGVTIGTFIGGAGGNNLVITFNSNATPTAVTALVKNITYENINTDSPIEGSCTIRFALTDGDGGTSANYDVSAWITGVNDAPLNSVPGSQSTNEDTNLIFSSGNGNQISITDPDNSGASFEATISVTNGTLTLAGTTGLTFVTGDGTADTTMTIRGTVANINAALNGLSYSPTADSNGGATLTIGTLDSSLVSLNIDANLQARYTFEGNANDVAPGTAQDGTLVNGATITTNGTRGQVLNLDGVNDYVELSAHRTSFETLAQGTIAMWIRTTDTSAELFSLSDTADVSSLAALWITSSGKISFDVWENNVNLLQVNSVTSVNDGQWHHVAVTVGAGGNQLYIDGVQASVTYVAGSSASTTFFSSVSGIDVVQLGRNSNSSGGGLYYTGLIDDTRIYTQALSAADITTLANDLNLTDTDTVSITVNAVNDAPTVTNLTGDSLAYSEGDGAVVIEQGGNVSVTDVDSTNFDTGTLTVSFTAGSDSAEDVLGVLNQGTGAGQIGVSGSNITYGGTVIGTYAGGSGGTNLVITLNSNATPTAVTALAQSITYENTDTSAPTTGARTVRYVLTDGDGGTSASYDTTVTVSAVNDTPTDLSLSANTVAENAANGTVVGTVAGTDPDTGDTKSYSFTDSASGRFAIDGTTGQITVANSSLLNYEAATSHSVTVRVTDSGGLTYDETFTITVTNVNEAPTGADATITINEDTSHTLTTANFGFNDVDAGDSLNAVRFDTVPGAGTLTLSGVAVTNGQVIAVSDITAGNLVFTPAADANGAGYASVTFSVRDSNNAYDAAPNTLTFNITTVNDAPVITPIAPDVTFVEGGMAQVIDATGTITDVDSSNFDGGVMTVSISANGTVDDRLMVGNWGTGLGQVGVSGSTVTYEGTVIGTVSGGTSGSDPLIITFNPSATPTAVQEVYRSIQFENVSDNPSTATRTLSIGLTDGDGGTATPQTKLVYVQATNDAPVMTFGEGDKNFTEGALAVMIDALPNVSDLDSTNFDTGTLTITISANPSVDDRVELLNTGMGAGQIGVSGTNVYYGGTLIGTQAGGIGAVPFVVTFNANADAAIVGEVMANIRFWVAGDAPSTAARTVEAVLTDGDGGTSLTASKQITVTAVNDPTVITGGTSGTGNEDTTMTGTLTATDAEGLSDGTVFTVSTGATNGTASIDPATGLWSYSPNADYNGSDSFTVTITDDAGNTSTQVISLTVSPVVDITGDSLTTTEDNAISANVLTGTNGATADSFEGTPVLTSVTQGANGSVTFLANGTVTYTPTANFSGTDSFTYTSTSGGVTETATVNVTVTAVNGAPTDLSLSANTVAENAANGTVIGTVSGTDPDSGDTKAYSFTDSASGRFAIDGATGQITVADGTLLNYESAASHTVTVRVTDGGGLTYDETFTINLTNINETPTGADATITINEDTSHTLTTANFGFSDVDAGDSLSAVRIDALPSTGTLTLSGVTVTAGQVITVADITAGNLVFTPVADANGTGYAGFTFSVRDSNNAYDAAPNAITFDVTPINDAPIAGDDSYTIQEDGVLTVDVSSGLLATDMEIDGDSISTILVSGPSYGSLTLNTDGSFSYTPNANYSGPDSFTYRVTDGTLQSNVATVFLTVSPVNDVPLLVTNSGSTVTEGATDTIDSGELAVTDVDHAAAQLTYSIGTGPVYGRLELTTAPGVSATAFTQADIAANRVVYIHDGSETTSDSFSFTVTDGAGGSLGATTVTLTITPVNDAPTITSLGGGATAAVNVAENVTAVTVVAGQDVDLPAQALTYGISGGIDQALFTIDVSTGALSFTAPPDFEVATDASGDNIYLVQVRVTDSLGASVTQLIQVTVTDVVEGTPATGLPPSLVPTPSPPTPGLPVPPAPVSPPGATLTPESPVQPSAGVARVLPGSLPTRFAPEAAGRIGFKPEELRPAAEAVVLGPGRVPVDDETAAIMGGLQPVEETEPPPPEPQSSPLPVSDLLFAKLDAVAESLQEAMAVEDAQQTFAVRLAAVSSLTLSVGFVAWALRGTALLASLFATLPAWQTIDPLPVVTSRRKDRERRRQAQREAARREQAQYQGLNDLLDDDDRLQARRPPAA